MSGLVDLNSKVLIVGAGPVGLSMACELYRHGIPCRIVDQSSGPSGESRAIAVQARTLELFEGMGIINEVLALGRKIHQANLYHDNKRLARLLFDELDSPYPFILTLPQCQLEALLLDRLAHFGGEVEWQKSLLRLQQDQMGVAATLQYQGQEETILSPWLIGCDGMDSTVGQLLDVSCEEITGHQVFLLVDIRMQWELADDEVHQFLSAQGLLAAFPLPETSYWRLIIEFFGQVPKRPPLEFVQHFLQKMEVAGATMGEPTWVSYYQIKRRLAHQFQVGHCFLAGDAAHTYSPVGGQGMNMGIQDAYNLAWKLALVIQRQAWEWLLKSYHNERYPIAAATLRGTERATKVVMFRHPVSRQLRKRAAALLGHFEVVQQRITRRLVELDLSYQQSSIVEEYHMPLLGSCLHITDKQIPTTVACLEFGAAPKAGQRAPDLLLQGPDGASGRRLFELLQGTRHKLFLFSGANPNTDTERALAAVCELVCKQYGQSIEVYVVVPRGSHPETLPWQGSLLLDADGVLHRHYGVLSGGMYLIRPDGHIGFRSQPILEKVFSAYLRRMFIHAEQKVT